MMLKRYLLSTFALQSIATAETAVSRVSVSPTSHIQVNSSDVVIAECNISGICGTDITEVYSPITSMSRGNNSYVVTTGSSLSSKISNSSNKTLSTPVFNGLVSEEMYKKVSGILSQFTFPMLVVSLLCVVASIAVYTSPLMRTRTNTYLVFLGCADLLYVIGVLVIETMSVVYGDFAITSKLYLSVAIYGGNYISVCCRRVAYSITLLVTLERFIAVVFPLRLSHSRVLKYPRLLIPVTTLVVFIFNVYSALKNEVVPLPGSNNTAYKLSRTAFYQENSSTFYVLSVVGKAIFVFLPLSGCLLFNLVTVICLSRQAKIRRSLSSGTESRIFQNERQTTVTIIVSTFLYVLLNLPVSLSSTVSSNVDGYGLGEQQHYLFLLMNVIGYVCENVGCISNFITYLVLCDRFRRVFCGFFCCCCQKARTRTTANTRSRSHTLSGFPEVSNTASLPDLNDTDISVTISETVN